jgi:hypothetical protein
MTIRVIGLHPSRVCLALALALAGAPLAVARADKVHLQGGTVLEGKATQAGEKVLVEVESGTLSLDARSVVRIDRAPSAFETFQQRRAGLRKGDIAARIELADYCRAHELPARERELLREVIEIDPDHVQARARLGFVRTERGWLTHDEHMAALGMVREGGVWISREEALRLREAELARQTAELEREKAQSELQAKRAELNAERERNQQLARERAALAAMPAYYYPSYYYPARQSVNLLPPSMRPTHPMAGPPAPPPNYAINGVRDPASYFR